MKIIQRTLKIPSCPGSPRSIVLESLGGKGCGTHGGMPLPGRTHVPDGGKDVSTHPSVVIPFRDCLSHRAALAKGMPFPGQC